MRLHLLGGVFPKPDNEIVVEKHLLKEVNKDAKIGDKIELPVKTEQEGQRVIEKKTFILSSMIDTGHSEWLREEYDLALCFL